jgi:hypothetical protein
MAEDGLTGLERELRATVPDALKRLPDEDLRHLADAVRDARHRQAAALEAAGDHALGHVPKLLRGPIRKVVGA